MSDEVPTTASEWVVRVHSGTMSAEDHARFARWLAKEPSHRSEFETTQRIWLVANRLGRSPMARKQLLDMAGRSAPPANARRLPHWAAWPARSRAAQIAAAVGLAVGIYVTVAPSRPQAPPMLHSGDTAETTIDQISNYSLPDGSALTVNADSKVRIAFSKDRRLVVLERGEAFFDVHHNASWPFVVTAGSRTVVVTGTKFDVDRGNAEKAVEVAVMEGHVQVAPDAAHAPTLPTNSLAAGEVILFPEGKPGVRLELSASQMTAWRSRRLYFDHSPLSDVVMNVNRYTKKQLVLADSTLTDLPLSGAFRAGDIDGVLFSLHELYDIHIEDAGDSWILTGAKERSSALPSPQNQRPA